MTTLDWDEPYPHDVVRLRTTKHYAKHRKHLCAECWHDIEIGERYICTVYVDNGKATQYKIHEACPYTFSVLKWIRDWWRGQ
jgi:hypothetical protein